MKKIKIISSTGGRYSRNVTRTWYNKRLGRDVTKTYHYGVKERYTERSSELIVKNGKITSYGEELKKALTKGKNDSWKHQIEHLLSKATNKGADLKESTLLSQVERAIEDEAVKNNIANIGEEGIQSRSGSIRQYIYNMGGDIADLAADMGIPESALADSSNWTFKKGGKAIFYYNGNTYTFNFKYKDNQIKWKKERR